MGKNDHIGRGANGDEANQCDQPHGLSVNMTEAQPQRAQNQGKLADLRYREPC